jgi:hypothetical protein
MYREGYVVSIRQNGQTIQEESGKCIIPFHTEYEIRLKNKTRKRALVDVYIDGQLATKGGLILGANDHIDLERFIGNDLSKGDRFMLVPLADRRVDDKSEPENGEIEVTFYPEKEYVPPTLDKYIYIEKCHSHCQVRWCPLCHRYHCSCEGCYPYWSYPTWTCNTTGGVTYGSASNSLRGSAMAINNAAIGEMKLGNDAGCLNSASFSASGEAGATAHGGTSHQSFSTGNIEADKSKPTTIKIKILGKAGTSKGPAVGKELGVFCTRCGNKLGIFDKFCSKCGNELGK